MGKYRLRYVGRKEFQSKAEMEAFRQSPEYEGLCDIYKWSATLKCWIVGRLSVGNKIIF